MTDRDRELMQRALEALEISSDYSTKHTAETYYTPLIQTLRERLAQPEHDWEAEYAKQVELHNQTLDELRDALAQPEQEPVAWLYRDSWGVMKLSQTMPPPVGAFPVYTAPPRRERLAQPEQEWVAGEYAVCLEDGERVLIASVLPVGYGGNKTRTIRVVWPDGMDGVYTMFQFARLFSPVGERATPPRREWQGLAADSTIQTVPAQGGLLPAQPGIRGGLAHDAQNKEKNA